MKMAEVDPYEEVFTHVNDVDGTQTTYATSSLFNYISTHEDEVEKCEVPVEEYHAAYCMERRGVEPDRLKVLFDHPEYLDKPIIFIHLPEGTHLLVDGTHRYVACWKLKRPYIPAYIVSWAVAQRFVIEDAPTTDEERLMQWSGLSVLRALRAAGKL
jgi:hypothetical protein